MVLTNQHTGAQNPISYTLFAYYIVKQWYRGLIEPILVWNSWHYHFCTWLKTNLSFEFDIGAPAQWQFYFGPLHGFSGHHTALWELGVVVHGSSTSWVPLGGRLEDHLECAGVWLQYYPVPLATAPVEDQKLSSDWPWVGDDSWERPGHQDLGEDNTMAVMAQMKNFTIQC